MAEPVRHATEIGKFSSISGGKTGPRIVKKNSPSAENYAGLDGIGSHTKTRLFTTNAQAELVDRIGTDLQLRIICVPTLRRGPRWSSYQS
ncbi:hypothetical protein RUM43_006724 [Polyplax serrata]|uniref:Uncharacterized protein n=1 Tax=Polyplax serrata TaxID=468196 RepID=A0AAN8P1N9_POLSC